MCGVVLMGGMVIMGVGGFKWGVDLSGGRVIEIRVEKGGEIEVMGDGLEKGGFEEGMVEKFGRRDEMMVGMGGGEGERGGEVVDWDGVVGEWWDGYIMVGEG